MKLDAFDEKGRPLHERGISNVRGLYFLGLAWLSRRASPFIWGVWHDAEYLANDIATRGSARRGSATARSAQKPHNPANLSAARRQA
jgi:putative flavoprotein involved in K+ transport